MSLKVAEVAYEVITELRPLLPRIKRSDRSLADQLLRAANSMVLNIGEAEYSDPGNRRSRFYSAAGSANETRSALRLAMAWGYVAPEQIARSGTLLNKVMAMLWRLSLVCCGDRRATAGSPFGRRSDRSVPGHLHSAPVQQRVDPKNCHRSGAAAPCHLSLKRRSRALTPKETWVAADLSAHCPLAMYLGRCGKGPPNPVPRAVRRCGRRWCRLSRQVRPLSTRFFRAWFM